MIISRRCLVMSVLILIGVDVSCSHENGKAHLLKSIASPDDAVVADWYKVDFGGASGASVDRVRLRNAGSAFTADDDFSFSAVTGYTMKVQWTASRELDISYDKAFAVQRASQRWQGVAITYAVIQRER